MPLSLYQASVPSFVRGLRVLSTLLHKGEQHAAQSGKPESALMEARLAPDMLTLVGQVQRASDTCKLSASRISGKDAPPFPDDETSFAELEERIAKTIRYLESLSEADFADSDTRTVEIKMGPAKVALPAAAFLTGFGLPNFYFHITTAYDILRNQGVALGKLDYIGPVDLV